MAAGGFDAHFVEPLPDRLTCSICQLATREPRVTVCGHQFCLECLRPLSRNGKTTCPLCRKKLKETEIYPSNKDKREILSLKIRCNKHEEGCNWIGELRKQNEHNQKCGHVAELCGNNCGELVMRKDKKNHESHECSRRIVGCRYCDRLLEHVQLFDHYKECPKYPVSCPHRCGVQVARRDMETHTSREGQCPNSPLQCDFTSMGCRFIGNRKELQYHLNKEMGHHLSLTVRSLHNVTERLAVAEKKQEEAEGKLAAVETKQKVELETLKQTLNFELQSSTFEMLITKGWSESLQSAEFVRAVLCKQNQISHEQDGTFAFFWKISNFCLPAFYSSKKFYHEISKVGLKLRLSSKCIDSTPISQASIRATVFFYRTRDFLEGRVKCQMSMCLLPQYSREFEGRDGLNITKDIDFITSDSLHLIHHSLSFLLDSVNEVFSIDLESPNTVPSHWTKELLIRFQLKRMEVAQSGGARRRPSEGERCILI
ncbi:TNF receptor-associated factor 5-like [Corticium candelabrum]|uniref:TNF receptor-associated factor 5-like n=1 Tax=Corticium candelabrum TaxID=121492 RepID=UPI002E265DC9|nr:TNF receptor-associated factor 5-like [Corticium candelabrum]